MSQEKDTVKHTGSILIGFAIVGLFIGSFVLWQALIAYEFIDGVSFFNHFGNANAFGTFGDFMGGTLNPVFSFLTFLALLYTILMQRKELSYTREELAYTREELKRSASAFEAQNFENTYFNLIKLQSEAIQNADYAGKTALSALGVIHKKFKYLDVLNVQQQLQYLENNIDESYTPQVEERLNKFKIDIKGVNAKLEYESALIFEHFERFGNHIDHYFRILFNILRLVEEHDDNCHDNEIPFKAKKYFRLLRANLSEAELGLIFYNCLTEDGKAMRDRAAKAALFDNMPLSALGRSAIMTQMPRKSFGDNQEILRLYDRYVKEGLEENPPFKTPLRGGA